MRWSLSFRKPLCTLILFVHVRSAQATRARRPSVIWAPEDVQNKAARNQLEEVDDLTL